MAAQILKTSVAFKETAGERIFLMKDLAEVEEAVDLGAEKVEGEISSYLGGRNLLQSLDSLNCPSLAHEDDTASLVRRIGGEPAS
jgi:hypothetical protein